MTPDLEGHGWFLRCGTRPVPTRVTAGKRPTLFFHAYRYGDFSGGFFLRDVMGFRAPDWLRYRIRRNGATVEFLVRAHAQSAF